MRPPDWQSAIEIHPPGWKCPDQPFWVAGWVVSAGGLVPLDVRAWFGHRLFLGLCGLPRPDKESAIRGQPGAPQAGFSFLLPPVAGATSLRIEVRDQHARWTPFFTQAVTSDGTSSPRPPRAPDADALLQLLRAAPAFPPGAHASLAAEILAAERAEGFDVMPSAPFHGALEELPDRAAVQYDHLLVTGWVAHREQSIRRLTAFLDTETPLPLVHGLSRPDAGTLFPGLVDGARSRFAGRLPIPDRAPQPLALRIFAELADGRQELVFLKRFRPVPTSGRGRDLPPFSPWRFARAAWALRQAGWGRGLPMGEVRRVVREAWHAYRLSAPLAETPPVPAADPVAAGSRGLRITLVTHNLALEGAPLFLLELARHLAAQPGWEVRVVAPADGPLRVRFVEAGVPVTLVTAPQVDDDPAAFDTALAQLAADAAWTGTEVIVANTMVAYWAIHLARRLRKPSLLYVHESVSARRFFALQARPAAIARIEEAFVQADRVVFVAAAAQRPHARLNGRRNFRVLPGWIDVARIRAYEAGHPRAEQRRALGLPDSAPVLACIGAVMPRKGQHVFVEAAARLARRAPPGPAPVFLIVGARPGPDPYADLLRHAVAGMSDVDLRIVEHSSDSYRFFQAADICVCPSLEEALPRVVMEAAAFGRLIVSTEVDGIPELVGPAEAWLVPPDDPDRLADAMSAALAAFQAGDRRQAERAQRTVTAGFDAAVLLPRHADLIRSVGTLSPP